MNLSYEKIYNQYAKYIPYKSEWNDRHNAQIKADYFKAFPKSKKFTPSKLSDEYFEKLNAEWNPVAQKLLDAYDRREKILKDLLFKLSLTEIEILPVDESNIL